MPDATRHPRPVARHRQSTVRRLEADDAGMRRRAAQGDREIAAHAERRHAGGDGGGFTAARSARGVVEVPGVVRLARQEVVGFDRVGEFWRIRLGDEDGAGGLQPGDDGGIGIGHAPLENRRTALRQHARRVDSILYRERNAMERTQSSARLDRGLGFSGSVQRALGHRHDGVHLGIDLGDTIEMGLHDLDRR